MNYKLEHNLRAVDFLNGNLRFSTENFLQLNSSFGSKFGDNEFTSTSMQFQELIQSSLIYKAPLF